MQYPTFSKTRLAEAISSLTNPALVLVISLVIIVSRYSANYEQLVSWAVIGTLLLVVPGLIYAAVSWRQDKEVDFDLTRREDRVVPLLLTTLGAVMVGYLVGQRFQNEKLELVSNTLVMMLVSLTIITLVWKVSLHVATLTALVTLIVIFRGPIFSILYLGIIPVAWARLTLKQHTKAQLTGGSLVGVGVTTLVSLLLS